MLRLPPAGDADRRGDRLRLLLRLLLLYDRPRRPPLRLRDLLGLRLWLRLRLE